jgi:hypothetical protein
MTIRTSQFFEKLIDWVKTGFLLWVCYSVLWIPFWLLAWLMKLTDDPTTVKIYEWVLFAGYPGLALVYCIVGLVSLPLYGIALVYMVTMPYGFYATPFIALAVYLWFRLFRKPKSKMTREQTEEALKKSKPEDYLNRPPPK